MERNRSGRSRSGGGGSHGESRNRSRSQPPKPKMLQAANVAERDAKRAAAAKRNRANGGSRRRKQPAAPPSLQSFLEKAIDDAANTALGMFDDDDDSQFSDEISFATGSSHGTSSGEKYSAADDSVEVAAVTTEKERKKLQQHQPDIATFRLKRNGRPYAVKKLVKQLAKEEQKLLRAQRALVEAEESMWKTKWKLYNLADEYGLLCGNCNGNEVEEEERDDHERTSAVVYDDDSYAYSDD
eukprot:scaffold14927_cov133-Skeletonema_marinoi.AAC.4